MNTTASQSLYLIEYYTVSPTGVTGWDIKFAWVHAESRSQAKEKLKAQVRNFDEVITCEEQAAVTRLHGCSAKDIKHIR